MVGFAEKKNNTNMLLNHFLNAIYMYEINRNIFKYCINVWNQERTKCAEKHLKKSEKCKMY